MFVNKNKRIISGDNVKRASIAQSDINLFIYLPLQHLVVHVFHNLSPNGKKYKNNLKPLKFKACYY